MRSALLSCYPGRVKRQHEFNEVQGVLLRGLRVDRGMTLRSAAATGGIGLGYLSEIERGSKIASPDMVETLCSLYGVRYTALLRTTADVMDLNERAGRMLYWSDYETEALARLDPRPVHSV